MRGGRRTSDVTDGRARETKGWVAMDVKYCRGCKDDFYNGKNPYGVAECWLLKDAELATRYRLHVDTPMSQRRGYQEVVVPNCYQLKRHIHLKAIPEYAR